jgi:hypothetical protein
MASTYYVLITYSPNGADVGYLTVGVTARDFPIFSNLTYWTISKVIEVRGVPTSTTLSVSALTTISLPYQLVIQATFRGNVIVTANTSLALSPNELRSVTLTFTVPTTLLNVFTSNEDLGHLVVTVAPEGVHVVPLPFLLGLLALLLPKLKRKGFLLILSPIDFVWLGLLIAAILILEIFLLLGSFALGATIGCHATTNITLKNPL